MNTTIGVLHLIDHYRVGGPGKTIINGFRFGEKRKFSIHVAAFVPECKGETEFTAEIRRQRIPFLGLKDSRGISLWSVLALRQYIQRNAIRILHSHAYKADILALIVKWTTPGLRVVTTHHGWIVNTSWQGMKMKADIFLARFFDGIIVVSKSLLSLVPQRVKNNMPCVLIHNAIVLDDYRTREEREAMRAQLSINMEQTVFAVVGRLSPEKGCIDMLKAFALVHKERPKTKLIFVGEGPLDKELRLKTEALGLTDAVIFAGHQRRVNPFYEAADAVVCPSITEGLSNVILEAFAYCLPVIATDVGGNGEILLDGINGIVVEPKDTEGMKAACLRLVDAPNVAAMFGKRGRETVEKAFDFSRRIRREEEFYETLIQ